MPNCGGIPALIDARAEPAKLPIGYKLTNSKRRTTEQPFACAS